MEEPSFVRDLPTGPKEPKSTVLSIEEEAIIVAFRKHKVVESVDRQALFDPRPNYAQKATPAALIGCSSSSWLLSVCGYFEENLMISIKFKTALVGAAAMV
jgi:hypothetical protein